MHVERCMAGLSFLLLWAACGEPAESFDAEVGVNDEERPLYVKESTIWNTRDISVCWENPSAGTSAQRSWVRTALQRTWEVAADVRFVGWNTCGRRSRGVRIEIDDDTPSVGELGDELDGKSDGMVLNFTFEDWGTACQGMEQFCIEAIAVHEFGHALGFAHEQNREDTPPWCDQEQGSDGDVVIGPWDLDSVMNYCNPNWNGNGELSRTDIEGAQKYYGLGAAYIQVASALL